jgi:hypothetical protein
MTELEKAFAVAARARASLERLARLFGVSREWLRKQSERTARRSRRARCLRVFAREALEFQGMELSATLEFLELANGLRCSPPLPAEAVLRIAEAAAIDVLCGRLQ